MTRRGRAFEPDRSKLASLNASIHIPIPGSQPYLDAILPGRLSNSPARLAWSTGSPTYFSAVKKMLAVF